MSRPKKFVENLSSEEILALEQGHKYGASPDYRLRCQGILLSHQGYELKQIAKILDCSYLAVYQWVVNDHEKGTRDVREKGTTFNLVILFRLCQKIFDSIAFTRDLKDVCMMDDSVNDCICQDIIPKDAPPLFEVSV